MSLHKNKSNTAPELDLRPRITVIGVGGAGSNAVNNMIRAKLEGVEFIVANTDAQALEQALVDNNKRIQLGLHITQGLGAGSKPDVGRASAEESIEEVINLIKGSNMVFITAGMGGGTGSGAAPVIARAARESGILTVGVVTKPFHFEGSHRSRTAERAIEELQQYVDTLIIIPNQNLFRIANERTTFADAFKMADDVLYSGVRGVTDLMMMPGLINLDFADIRAVMAEMGKAMMGTGEAEGERRALDAAEAAISNPLLDDVSMKGAKGVLINITGGYDMTLYEVDEAANRIREDVEADANIIFGSTFDERLNGRIRVSVVATGIGSDHAQAWRQTNATAEQISPVYANSSISRPNGIPSASAAAPNTVYSGFNATIIPSSNSSGHDASHNEQLASSTFERKSAEDYETDTYAKEQFETEGGDSSSYQNPSTQNNKTRENPQGNNSSYNNFENNFNSSNAPDRDKQEKKKTPSLFERFTGVSRNRTPQQNATTVEQSFKETSKNSEQKEADVLDIPAFLRRGSN